MQAEWIANYLANGGSLGPWMGYHGPRDANPNWGDSGYVPADVAPNASDQDEPGQGNRGLSIWNTKKGAFEKTGVDRPENGWARDRFALIDSFPDDQTHWAHAIGMSIGDGVAETIHALDDQQRHDPR